MPPVAVLRARWGWLVAGVAAGVALGVAAVGPSASVAQATLQLTQASADSQRVKQIGQTVERAVGSAAVVTAAAQARGIDPAGLAGRVEAVWQQDTDLVSVSVQAADAQQAVADANAVAAAVVSTRADQVADQLRQLQEEGNRLMSAGTLQDPSAEQARRSQLGYALASRQDSVIANATAVTVLDQAVQARPAGISAPVSGLLGGAGGGLLAGAAIMTVPIGRRRPASLPELRGLLPDLRIRPADQAAGELAGRLLESGRPCLAVVALPDTAQPAGALAVDIADCLRAHGPTVAVVDATRLDSPGHRQQVLSRQGRDVARSAADLLVLITDADTDSLTLLAGQTNLLATVVTRPRSTTLTAIRHTTTQLTLAQPSVTVTP